MEQEQEQEHQSEVKRNKGRVKWFNNKSGYGFVTILDGEKIGRDCFVHHSGIKDVKNPSQYNYLVEGEYIEFVLVPSKDGAHEFQASNITGICGGKLMCETRTRFAERKDRHVKVDNEIKEGVDNEWTNVVKKTKIN